MLNMTKIRTITIEKEELNTKIRKETVQDTVKRGKSTINNHF